MEESKQQCLNFWSNFQPLRNNNNSGLSNMNLLEITAQDLLGKSHEELVLLLIHVRRQSAALGEAADVARAELERNPGVPVIRFVLTKFLIPTVPLNIS